MNHNTGKLTFIFGLVCMLGYLVAAAYIMSLVPSAAELKPTIQAIQGTLR